MSQIPDSKPFPQPHENGQGFGWLDEILSPVLESAWFLARSGGSDLRDIQEKTKVSIQAHYTAQEKEAYDKEFSAGCIEQSKFDNLEGEK